MDDNIICGDAIDEMDSAYHDSCMYDPSITMYVLHIINCLYR